MFSNTYLEARSTFLNVAEQAGFTLTHEKMPGYLFSNEYAALTTDIASYINENTKKLVMINSGTHGIEGYYGSAIQSQLATHILKDLAPDIGIMMIHACNPYGFAFNERVDRSDHGQRVDPNRNFVNFTQSLPQNPGYKQSLEDILIPKKWYSAQRYWTTVKLLWQAFTAWFQPRTSIKAAIMAGQYTHPYGFSFGGTRAGWTNQIIHKQINIINDYPHIQDIVFIDLHTGIGKRGQITAYSTVANAHENHQRTKAWLNGIINTIASPYPATGSITNAILKAFPEKNVTAFSLEVGTQSKLTVLNALRAQSSLDNYPAENAKDETAIKAMMREAFYPSDATWRTQVTHTTMKIFARVFAQLTDPAPVAEQKPPSTFLSRLKLSFFAATKTSDKEIEMQIMPPSHALRQ